MRINLEIIAGVSVALFASQASAERFTGTVLAVSSETMSVKVDSESRIRTLRFSDQFSYSKLFNGCHGTSLAKMLRKGHRIEGTFDPSMGEALSWQVEAKRNRKQELLESRQQQCVAGTVLTKDATRRALSIEGDNGDLYEFLVPPEVQIICGGDMVVYYTLENLPAKVKRVMVKFSPEEPSDIARKIYGFHCGAPR